MRVADSDRLAGGGDSDSVSHVESGSAGCTLTSDCGVDTSAGVFAAGLPHACRPHIQHRVAVTGFSAPHSGQTPIGAGSSDMLHLRQNSQVAQRRQRHMPFAIQHVVRAEGNHMSAGEHVMNAALHQPPQVKIVGVEKRCDRDSKDIAG